MVILNFLRHFMDTFQCRSTLHGYITFMFLITVSIGSACEAPSSPLCFRRNAKATIYICEWSFNTNGSDVMFNFCFNGSTGEINCKNDMKSRDQFIEEWLIVGNTVDIWVEAHVGNSITCSSPRRSTILEDTVKYEALSNVSVLWLRNNLSLSWRAAEESPAEAEVLYQLHEQPTEYWETIITNTTNNVSTHTVIIKNLLKHSAYRVKIRHRSTQARNSLWSNWSPVIIVPAELEQKLEVKHTSTRLLNGTREVTLTWKGIPSAAALGGVNYSLSDTQTLNDCPCKMKTRVTDRHNYTINVSYSAVNITIIAQNEAGPSPPSIIQIPASRPADLKVCDKTLKMKRLRNVRTCLELYELQDADLKPENVMTLTAKTKDMKQKIENLKDYIRYLYFEQRCAGGKPQTVKMCLFYKKEGAPSKEPRNFMALKETDTSVTLSWKAIAYEDQRGFITHYKLCRVKISAQNEPKECFNLSASATDYQLENLAPGSKYNISLAGVTGGGEGVIASVIINTWPEKPVNVWMSFTLLFIFFFFSTTCTIILKRIKNKIFPPVPAPVIIHLPSYQQVGQEVKRKEEVHEFTLHQMKTVSEEATVTKEEQDEMTDDDVESESCDSEGSIDECDGRMSTEKALGKQELTNLKEVHNELDMLIYRNGLVFDAKTDSS